MKSAPQRKLLGELAQRWLLPLDRQTCRTAIDELITKISDGETVTVTGAPISLTQPAEQSVNLLLKIAQRLSLGMEQIHRLEERFERMRLELVKITDSKKRNRILLEFLRLITAGKNRRGDARAFKRNLELDAVRERFERWRQYELRSVGFAVRLFGGGLAEILQLTNSSEFGRFILHELKLDALLLDLLQHSHRRQVTVAVLDAYRWIISAMEPQQRTAALDIDIMRFIYKTCQDPQTDVWIQLACFEAAVLLDFDFTFSVAAQRLTDSSETVPDHDIFVRSGLIPVLLEHARAEAVFALLERSLMLPDSSEHVRMSFVRMLPQFDPDRAGGIDGRSEKSEGEARLQKSCIAPKLSLGTGDGSYVHKSVKQENRETSLTARVSEPQQFQTKPTGLTSDRVWRMLVKAADSKIESSYKVRLAAIISAIEFVQGKTRPAHRTTPVDEYVGLVVSGLQDEHALVVRGAIDLAVALSVDPQQGQRSPELTGVRLTILDQLDRVVSGHEDIRVRRWAAEAREKIWVPNLDGFEKFAGELAPKLGKLKLGARLHVSNGLLPTDEITLGRIAAYFSSNDFNLNIKPGSHRTTFQRDERYRRRLWRLLHELAHPAPDKRQDVSHVRGRLCYGSLRAPSRLMAEAVPSKVVGEPLVGKDGTWRPFLPLVDDFLSLLDWRFFKTGIKIFSAEGVTEIVKPKSLVRRLLARFSLVFRYAGYAALRNQELSGGGASQGHPLIEAMERLGFSVSFTPHRYVLDDHVLGACDPMVVRHFSTVLEVVAEQGRRS